MPSYKNIGLSDISFCGKTVKPGQVETFPKCIMHKDLVPCKVDGGVKTPFSVEHKPLRRKPRKEAQPVEEAAAPVMEQAEENGQSSPESQES